MTRPFTSKDFADETVINLMSRLVKIPDLPHRKNGVELEKLKSMTPEEIRVEFAHINNSIRNSSILHLFWFLIKFN